MSNKIIKYGKDIFRLSGTYNTNNFIVYDFDNDYMKLDNFQRHLEIFHKKNVKIHTQNLFILYSRREFTNNILSPEVFPNVENIYTDCDINEYILWKFQNKSTRKPVIHTPLYEELRTKLTYSDSILLPHFHISKSQIEKKITQLSANEITNYDSEWN